MDGIDAAMVPGVDDVVDPISIGLVKLPAESLNCAVKVFDTPKLPKVEKGMLKDEPKQIGDAIFDVEILAPVNIIFPIRLPEAS